MHGTRHDRGDDRGDTTHYRSLEPYYRTASGSPVSRAADREADGTVPWVDDPTNGSAGHGSARYGASGNGAAGYGSGDETMAYGAAGYGATGHQRRGAYALPPSAPHGYASGDRWDQRGVDRAGPGYRDGADRRAASGERNGSAYPGEGRGERVYGEIAPSYRRAPGEEYAPRRAAGEPRRRAANEPPRRPANAEPARKPVAQKRKRKPMPLWQEMPLLLVVAFCLAVLIRTFLVQAFFIPSGSMTDTLLIGDRVLVNKTVYEMRAPRRGEIVVFSGTDSWVPEVPPEPNVSFGTRLGRTVGDLIGVSRPGDKDFIKRVIGLPGDKVSCCDDVGRVLVNGRPLDEPYVVENSPLDVEPNPRECRSRRFAEVSVPPGQMFVMGDHRLVSQDSRCQGTVPIDNVIGKAFAIVWPSESWATLPTPSTFDGIPDGAVAVGAPDAGPLPAPATGTFGIVMPILLALGFPARTRRNLPLDRRRLGA